MKPGFDFEKLVYDAVKRHLGGELLGLLPDACHVFHNKAYFSRDRESQIVTDVSIEVHMPDALEPHIIWVWECKDHRRLVHVGDVEEFHSKLQQIGADRTKGTIITRRGFQDAALRFAQANGIGLARYSEEIAWVSRLTGIPREFIALLKKQEVIETILGGDESFTTQTGINCFGLSSEQMPLWAHGLANYLGLHVNAELLHLALIVVKDNKLHRGPRFPDELNAAPNVVQPK